MWCIPEITPEFRERMYDILDLYREPYNPKKPTIGLDEKPKQLIEDSKKPIPMKPGKPEKYDHEYIRRGNANIFMAIEFKAGRRTARVTCRRTKRDFAKFVKHLVDRVYPDAEILRLVVDNLNTHNETAFYETYDAEEAQRILSKIEFHYTPIHASWLNVAEIEIGVMDAECTGRRIKDKKILSREVRAWTNRRNKQKKKIDWRFTTQKADEKLSKYYV
jgi:DDE superfamily endonuclease